MADVATRPLERRRNTQSVSKPASMVFNTSIELANPHFSFKAENQEQAIAHDSKQAQLTMDHKKLNSLQFLSAHQQYNWAENEKKALEGGYRQNHWNGRF